MNDDLNNIIYDGKMDYTDLRQIIFDYFEKNQNLKLGSASIDYLRGKLRDSDDPRPFFSIRNEFGETRFDIPKEDIQKILGSYLANKGYELLSVDYDYKIEYKYKQNPEIKHKKEEKVELNIIYEGRIDYRFLRQIIFDYYEENKGIKLSSTSIGYLENKLKGGNDPRPFFVIRNEFGETRFDIPEDEIKMILSDYFSKKNIELTELKYGDSVEFKYKLVNSHDKKISDSNARNNESGEIIRDGGLSIMTPPFSDEIPHFEPPKEESNNSKETDLDKAEKYEKEVPVKDKVVRNNTNIVAEKELADVKYEIIKRERKRGKYQEMKTKSGILCGICLIGAIGVSLFNPTLKDKFINHEADRLSAMPDTIFSWDAQKEVLDDFIEAGPVADVLAVGAASFAALYLINSKRLEEATLDEEDYKETHSGLGGGSL